MNRAQRRSASKLKRGFKIPEHIAPVPSGAGTHFLLGLVCLLRSPIESLKALGLIAEMRDKQSRR